MEGTPQNNDNRQIEAGQERGLDAGVVFGRNRHFAFVYRKTEKLVTAVYMVTNFIKDNEPLKWKIREDALSLMELNLDWNSVSLSERRELLKEYRALALEIVSLSGIARHAGLISEMNFHILSREFGTLVSILEKDESKREAEETVVLDPGFFETSEPEPLRQAQSASQTMSHTHVSAAAPFSKGQPSRTIQPATDIARPAKKSEYLPIKDAEAKASKSVESKDDRQATIIKLLSKKSGLGIKDFAESIKGVSEKTIQRELLAMVSAGVLKKEGERRWSTYSLA